MSKRLWDKERPMSIDGWCCTSIGKPRKSRLIIFLGEMRERWVLMVAVLLIGSTPAPLALMARDPLPKELSCPLTCTNISDVRPGKVLLGGESPLLVRVARVNGVRETSLVQVELNLSSPLLPRGSARMMELEISLLFGRSFLQQAPASRSFAQLAGSCQIGSRGTLVLWAAGIPSAPQPFLLRPLSCDCPLLAANLCLNLARLLFELESTAMGSVLLLDLGQDPCLLLADRRGRVSLLLPGDFVAFPKGSRLMQGRPCASGRDCWLEGRYATAESECLQGACLGYTPSSNLLTAFPTYFDPLLALIARSLANPRTLRLVDTLRRAGRTPDLSPARLLAVLELIAKSVMSEQSRSTVQFSSTG